MLNLFQHLLIYSRLRVKPAMTRVQYTGFLEVPQILINSGETKIKLSAGLYIVTINNRYGKIC